MKYFKLALVVPVLISICFFSCGKGGSNPDTTPVPPTTDPVVQPVILAISSFSPTNGAAGTTVTITGTGFGTNIDLIKVKFGSSVAISPAAFTTTQLTVVVPPDATTGKIAVSVNNATFATSVTDYAIGNVNQPVVDYSGYNIINYTGRVQSSSNIRYNMAAAGAGDKIVFGGGGDNGAGGYSSDAVDIYDLITNTWSTAKLSERRYSLAAAAAGNKILFAGGNIDAVKVSDRVDIYDVSTNTWTTAKLSQARTKIAAAAAGNKIIFAGGITENYAYSTTVDIYDVVLNSWTTAKINMGARDLTGAGTGNKALISHGFDCDVFDAPSLSIGTTRPNAAPSGGLSGAGTGTKIVFAGNSTNAAVYDVITQQWTNAAIPVPIGTVPAVGAGTKIVFGGGFNTSGYVYDVITNAFTAITAGNSSDMGAAAATKNKIVFAVNVNSKMGFDMYTLSRQ